MLAEDSQWDLCQRGNTCQEGTDTVLGHLWIRKIYLLMLTVHELCLGSGIIDRAKEYKCNGMQEASTEHFITTLLDKRSKYQFCSKSNA